MKLLCSSCFDEVGQLLNSRICIMTIETWFIILLAVIAVAAITLLLFLGLLGDEGIRMHHMKHRRGKYVNDQTAVICRTIIDTDDPVKAYSLFIEYVFTNHKQYMRYVANMLTRISEAYHAANILALKECMDDIAEMKKELKDQKITQELCVEPIDPAFVVESSAWVNLATELRFTVNESLRRLAKVCIEYNTLYSMPIPDAYTDQLSFMIQDICNICKSTEELLAAGDVEGMKELRIRTGIIKSESYDVAQRLFQLLHDGRTQIDPARHVALSYALNAFQECYCIIYALRRIVLCNLCLTLYATEAIYDNVTSDELIKYNS